jgi:hypothetical protein
MLWNNSKNSIFPVKNEVRQNELETKTAISLPRLSKRFDVKKAIAAHAKTG